MQKVVINKENNRLYTASSTNLCKMWMSAPPIFLVFWPLRMGMLSPHHHVRSSAFIRVISESNHLDNKALQSKVISV